MDLAALRTRVRTISGIEMTTLRSDAEIDSVINEVYLELCDTARWPFLEAVGTFDTVAGDADYSLPAGVAVARTLTLEQVDGPSDLTETTQRFIDRYVDGASESEPVAYARTNAGVTLAPTPDRVYTVQVRGYSQPADLALATDEPVFDSRFHPAVAYAAAAVLLNEEGQPERAEQALARTASFLDRMRTHYLESADDEPVIMGRGHRPALRSAEGRLWPGR